MPNQKYSRKRIFGTETEYGTVDAAERNATWLDNGASVYWDSGHLEYASPETTNPMDAVLYNLAGDAFIMKNREQWSKFYKNNWSHNKEGDVVFYGAHENYFIHRNVVPDLKDMALFLMTRQVYTGNGKITPKGKFEISQKANSIERLTGGRTTSQRDIIHSKDEPHSNLTDWYRFHVHIGDANMCEVAQYLKLGTTSLALDLLEDHLSPDIDYDILYVVDDFHAVSKMTEYWNLVGIKHSALDVQRAYLDAAKKNYSGRDTITDDIISRWDSTLDALKHDQQSLFGQVDWITKKILLDSYAAKHGIDVANNYGNDILRNMDLQYHEVDRDKGLFYTLQNKGLIERLFSDEDIELAVHNPPSDTRAGFRVKAVKVIQKYPLQHNTSRYWEGYHICKECNRDHILARRLGSEFTAGNPWNTYPEQSKILDDILINGDRHA